MLITLTGGERIHSPELDLLTTLARIIPETLTIFRLNTEKGLQDMLLGSDSKKKYPKNAQLLVHLFGERDAIECHRHMVVVSEIKAASLCAHFPSPPPKRNRLGPVE